MSLQSALQRINELRSLTGDLPQVDRSTPAGADTSGQFAAMLQAQMSSNAQQQNDLELPSTSLASGLPQYPSSAFGAQGGYMPSMNGMYGATGMPPMGAGSGMNGMYGMSGISGMNGVQFPTWPGASSVGARMVQLAQNEIGVQESPPGSNDAPRIREYRTATAGAENQPGPWCAYFVSWLARQAGAPIGANGNGTGYVPTLAAWGQQTGRFVGASATPQPGDIVIFSRGGIPGHTGIVENVGMDGRVHTIEGNSSDRVARRDYAAGSSEIIGYVRAG